MEQQMEEFIFEYIKEKPAGDKDIPNCDVKILCLLVMKWKDKAEKLGSAEVIQSRYRKEMVT